MNLSNPFDALCWVSQTTFPDDLEEGLISVGAPAEVAQEIRFAYQLTSARHIMIFYEDYAYAPNNEDWRKYLSAFLVKRMADYQSQADISPFGKATS